MRRAQPRYAAAFLVNQNRSVVAADALTQRSDEFPDLRGRAAVASEQNKAERIGGRKKTPLKRAEALARTT